jgi:hypothetical protein
MRTYNLMKFMAHNIVTTYEPKLQVVTLKAIQYLLKLGETFK